MLLQIVLGNNPFLITFVRGIPRLPFPFQYDFQLAQQLAILRKIVPVLHEGKGIEIWGPGGEAQYFGTGPELLDSKIQGIDCQISASGSNTFEDSVELSKGPGVYLERIFQSNDFIFHGLENVFDRSGKRHICLRLPGFSG